MKDPQSETQTRELIEKIRYLRDVAGLSFRQIGKELGIWRERCSKLYAEPNQIAQTRRNQLDAYRDLITHWYHECPSLKAVQVWNRLRQRDVAVSQRSVSEYTREFRQRSQKCYFPLTFHPGEEAQVDWFFFNHPVLGKLAGFVLILSFSRYCFARFFPRYSFEFFVQGHLAAFAAMQGVTQALRYDNLKSVVLKRTPLTYNPAFLEFARHYAFEIRLCNPGCGNEKGRVERLIRSIRETFCNTASTESSLDALNQALEQWCAEKNKTIHRSTGKVPAVLKEREALKSLPSGTWLNCHIVQTRSSKTGLVTVDTNRYSVPEHLALAALAIHVYCDRIEVYDSKQHRVASHPRSFARNQTILNPTHRTFARISPAAKQERIFTVISQLDPAVKQFLARSQDAGDDPYAAAHTIFTLLSNHSRQCVLSAVREALQRRLPKIKFVLSLLLPAAEQIQQEVLPQRHELLKLDYQPRSLEDYEKLG